MRSSNKSRSRNKNNNNNRRHNPSNVVNRVFDSSGPEGKVRGTPQQIIDKYQALARDAQLSGDRIAHENFLQHSEHYSRILREATREMAERKEAQLAQQQAQAEQNQQSNQNGGNGAQPKQPQQPQQHGSDQPSISAAPDQEVFPGESMDSDLVATPENAGAKKRAPNKRPAKKMAPKKDQAPSSEEAPSAEPSSSAEAPG